jgi:nicotinamide-nucleotide amidase
MRATIIAIGSELLGDLRSDTNSLFLAGRLAAHGVDVARKVIVADRMDDIVREIGRTLEESTLVLITGGLGPTQDDLTRPAVARALGRTLQRDEAIVEDIRAKFARFGRDMAEVNARQAEVIDGAVVLDNRRGTAPGLRLEAEGKTLFLFPGVPHELRGLVEQALEPWLAQHGPGTSIEQRVFRVACIGESDLENRLEGFYSRFGDEGVSLLPSRGEVTIGLTIGGATAARDTWFEPREAALETLLGRHVFGRRSDDRLEDVVAALLIEHHWTVATAESCTGGGIAQRLTAVPGSSAYFLGAAVTYSNRLKVEMLGVPGPMIERHGAVSSEVAIAMAEGVCLRLGSDYGLAVTGIAGPGGGSADKPVGTVHIALAKADRTGTVAQRLLLPGDRSRVRRLTEQWALDLLRRELLTPGGHPGEDPRPSGGKTNT